MSVPLVTAITNAIGTIGNLWLEYMKSADRRRVRKCIDAAEKYIQANEGEGRFSEMKEQRRIQHRISYRNKFYNLNN